MTHQIKKLYMSAVKKSWVAKALQQQKRKDLCKLMEDFGETTELWYRFQKKNPLPILSYRKIKRMKHHSATLLVWNYEVGSPCFNWWVLFKHAEQVRIYQ